MRLLQVLGDEEVQAPPDCGLAWVTEYRLGSGVELADHALGIGDDHCVCGHRVIIFAWTVPFADPLSEHRLDDTPGTQVYLYVDDVDGLVGRLGVSAEDQPWGMREARVTDPDGNVLRIGAQLRDAALP